MEAARPKRLIEILENVDDVAFAPQFGKISARVLWPKSAEISYDFGPTHQKDYLYVIPSKTFPENPAAFRRVSERDFEQLADHLLEYIIWSTGEGYSKKDMRDPLDMLTKTASCAILDPSGSPYAWVTYTGVFNWTPFPFVIRPDLNARQDIDIFAYCRFNNPTFPTREEYIKMNSASQLEPLANS